MDEDSAWVFDSLICFLNGPVWNAPLQSFIEEKSLIFEPNNADNVEYSKVFDEFKNLVDFMLGNFMEDIGITPVQFEDACNKGNQDGIPITFDQNLFELIWAANDFEMFKRMMTQRNVELQLQALELIEQKYGITPQSFIPKGKESQHRTGETTVEISPTPTIKPPKLEDQIMEEVIQRFPNQKESEDSTDVQYLLQEKNVLKETLKNIDVAKRPSTAKPPLLEDVKEEIPQTSTSKENKLTNNIVTKEEISFDKIPKAEVDANELKKRQEYLKAQRDKLVALKKEARKKHLDNDVINVQSSKTRPKSAKAAGDLLAGSSTGNLEPQQLQFRKTLVERLKTEVMAHKEDEIF